MKSKLHADHIYKPSGGDFQHIWGKTPLNLHKT